MFKYFRAERVVGGLEKMKRHYEESDEIEFRAKRTRQQYFYEIRL